MKPIKRIGCLLVSGLIVAATITPVRAESGAEPTWKMLFQPLPETAETPLNPVTPEKIALGRKLYFEPALSLGNDISCNSCHNLATFGVDNEPTSPGHQGVRGDRNSPTVYNAALHIAQFWDGRARDVEEQALGPVMNPKEMAMPSEDVVLERLKGSDDYSKMFKAAFPGEPDPITFKNMGKAIGAFERTLLTPSRFDRYLKGEKTALTAEELQGAQTFVEVGCVTCHNGVGVGGNMYQKLGLIKPYPTNDLGRYTLTKSESDRYVFKVPSLRNVEKTAPYFHDGSIRTLEEAITVMGEHQLGRTLTRQQVASIAAFLRALTGEIPASES